MNSNTVASPGITPNQKPTTAALISAVEDLPWLTAYFLKSDWHLLYCNNKALEWLDPGQKALSEETYLQDIIGIEHIDLLKNQILPQAEVLGSWTGDIMMRDSWGSEFPTFANFKLQKDRESGAMWVHVNAVKVREKDSGLKGLATSDREFLHALLTTLPENIYFKDSHSRFLRVSANMVRHFGVSDANEMLGKTDFDFFKAEHAQPAFHDEQMILRTGESIRDQEEKETHADNRVTWVSTSKFPLRDREGNIVGTFGISRDITERKLAEAKEKEMELQLRLSQKLESIGRLASGVAHEINTPAQFITDNTQFMKRSLGPLIAALRTYKELRSAVANGKPTQQILEDIATLEKESRLDFLMKELPQTIEDTLEGLARVTSIVRSLKEFSHPNKVIKAPMNLNRAIETTVAVSKHEWKYVAKVELNLDPTLPSVVGVVDEINQVLLNLIVNAAQAIEERIKAEKSSELGRIALKTHREGDFVVIEIEDTGAGIPDEVKDRIFDPFFTTKEVGKGTGQGLAIARTVVVRNHGGTIECNSTQGVGTTFKISLPITSTV